MRLRPVLLTVTAALAGLATLTACTSDATTADPTRSGSSSATASSASGATALVAALRGGVKNLTSAHFVITGTAAGQALSGSGVQRVQAGRLTGLRADAALPGGLGNVALVIDGTDRYVKLPGALATAGKPWVRVTSTSGSIVVKQLSALLDAASAGADLSGLSDVAGAAKSVRARGTEQINRAPATRYDLVVDPAKLPANLAGSAGLGTADIPAGIWLDSQNRPVRVQAKVPVAGQPVDITITFDRFGAPVTITPPAASEIAPA